jgi:hypothetical protein
MERVSPSRREGAGGRAPGDTTPAWRSPRAWISRHIAAHRAALGRTRRTGRRVRQPTSGAAHRHGGARSRSRDVDSGQGGDRPGEGPAHLNPAPQAPPRARPGRAACTNRTGRAARGQESGNGAASPLRFAAAGPSRPLGVAALAPATRTCRWTSRRYRRRLCPGPLRPPRRAVLITPIGPITIVSSQLSLLESRPCHAPRCPAVGPNAQP